MSVSFFIESEYEDINMCNRNAMMVLKTLGYDEADYCGSFDNPKDLIWHCNEAISVLQSMPELDAKVNDVESRGENEARIIDCGLPEGYMLGRITELKRMAERADALHKKIIWC